jgi:metal-sulfur cluster biosynthetic enzyme
MTTTYPSLRTHAANDASCPALWDALRDVADPEFSVSVVDLGLIVDLTQQDSIVDVKVTFTAMGCPATEFILDDIRARLLREPGVRDVHLQVVWSPVWTKERISEEGIDMMRTWGVSV